MTDEMKDKIQKLIEYILKEFPDGCNTEPMCREDCPLKPHGATPFQHNLCKLLLDMTGKKRGGT